MPWHIEWSPQALKGASKLEQKEAQRIIKKMEAASGNPHANFERLSGHQEYKIRIGQYRAICLLLESSQTIYIEQVGHRKNVYKKFPKKQD